MSFYNSRDMKLGMIMITMIYLIMEYIWMCDLNVFL